MFRSWFHNLIAPRLPAQAHRRLQRFRPQLETLEDRLAPSGFDHTPIQGYEGGGNASTTSGGYVNLRVEQLPNGPILIII